MVALSATEQLRNLIKGASLSELTDQVNKAKREMEGFWHMTGGAEEAAEKLAIALRAQKLEQRALNDLLLKAQGKATSFDQYQNKNALAEQKAAALEADKVWRARAEEYEIAQKITAERKREAKEAERKARLEAKRAHEEMMEGLKNAVLISLVVGFAVTALLFVLLFLPN